MMSREMKDSGIEWIGEIPKGWNLTRLRFLCSIDTGNRDTVNKEDDGLYPFYVRSPKIERISTYSYDGEAVLMAGDGVGAGKVFHYVNGKFDYHQRVYNLHKFKNIIGKYVHYYLTSNFWRKMEEGNAKSTVDSVRLPMLLDFSVCIPSISDQQKIANQLDTKCAEIDNLISLQEEMIAELKAYKQSVITEAVCKGLDKNVPMKDSGVEWIGEIPVGWEIKDFKRIFTLGKGLPITKADLVEQGISVISYGQIHSKANTNTKVNDNLIRFVSNTYIETNRESLVVKGDFIFADTSEDLEGCGNCVYVDVDKQIFAGYHTITAHPIIPMHGQYLAFLFITDCWRSQIRSMVTGVKLFSISRKILSKNTIIFPPLSEQQAIANYLDKKCANIDELISIKQQKAIELKEYKKSMIYEYVTGKKEVI